MLIQKLHPTKWLAELLNLSETTIERLRIKNPTALPPHVVIGRSIRYDESVVKNWLQSKLMYDSSKNSQIEGGSHV